MTLTCYSPDELFHIIEASQDYTFMFVCLLVLVGFNVGGIVGYIIGKYVLSEQEVKQ